MAKDLDEDQDDLIEEDATPELAEGNMGSEDDLTVPYEIGILNIDDGSEEAEGGATNVDEYEEIEESDATEKVKKRLVVGQTDESDAGDGTPKEKDEFLDKSNFDEDDWPYEDS